jgi:hypothetical protein
MCSPSSLLVGFEPEKMKAILDVLYQDVNHAVASGSRLVVPSELASNCLKRARVSDNSLSTSYLPIAHQPSAMVTYPVEAVCGGATVVECNRSRRDLKSCLSRAATAVEQLGVIEQMKDENRFLKRLWDKEVSGSTADPITVGSICGACQNLYKHKMRTLLYCYKVRCRGDMARFLSQHGERVINGKIVINNFTSVCKHGIVDAVLPQ